MTFLRATTTDGATEYFNTSKILTITPYVHRTKILMGAGLGYWVLTESIEIVTLPKVLEEINQ